MKKRLLYALATLVVLLASAGTYTRVVTDDPPPPTCNPLTDPRCK